MKRFVLILAAVVYGQILFLSPGIAATLPKEPVEILDLQGEVSVRVPPALDLKKAEKGNQLTEGSEIVTGSGSSCRVGIGEDQKSAIKLYDNSRAILTSLDPVRIDLQSGRIFSLVRGLRKDSTFEVKTPTAIAAARGTGWEQTSKEISVLENTVHVQGSAGQETDVEEGKGIQMNQDGTFGGPFDISEGSKSEWNQFKSETQGSSGEPGDFDHESLAEQGQQSQENLSDSKEDSRESQDQKDISDKFTADKTSKSTGGY